MTLGVAACLTPGVAGAADTGAPAGGRYQWPFDPPIAITSTFGEFRRGHFHGGIDLSTAKATGRPVKAASDGWVWRVRASGIGYGRVLYCRLDDGATAVYAHLESFAPAIDAYVAAAQESLSRYEVDLRPEPGRLPFRRGDILGRSGQSGAGPPHLHFEIRNGEEANLGVNPLTTLFTAPDTTAPLLQLVRIEPFGAGSTVDGETRTKTFTPVIQGGIGRLRDTPRIHGAARVSIRAVDPAPGGNRLAPYRAHLELDGAIVYAVTFDRFDWERANEVELAYNWERSRAGESFAINLYRPEGGTSEVFGSFPSLAGVLSAEGDAAAAPGEREARIVVADAAGNEARVAFRLTLEPHVEPFFTAIRNPARPMSTRPPVSSSARPTALDFAWSGDAPDGAHVTLLTPPGQRNARFVTGNPGSRASVPLPEGFYSPVGLILQNGEEAWTETLQVAVVTRGPAAELRLGPLVLDAPAQAFFGPGAIEWREEPPASVTGLVPSGRAVVLDAPGLVLAKPVRLSLPLPAGGAAGRLGLYRRTDGGAWDWLGNETSDGRMSGETRYLTAVALFEDLTPPVIGTFRPGPGAVVRTPRPSLLAGLRDTGSGFSWREIEATIDGIPQIVVYDPEAGTLTGKSRRDLVPGEHTWTVTVRDRAGNATTRSAVFRVR